MQTYLLVEAMIEASERLGDPKGCSIIDSDQGDWTVEDRIELAKALGEDEQRYILRQGIYTVEDIIFPAIYMVEVDEEGEETDEKHWIVSRMSMRAIWATDPTVELHIHGQKMEI